MGSRKRGREEMEASQPAFEPTKLDRLRNTWEFANIMQYIFIFGRVVKIDEDLSIEVLSPTLLHNPFDALRKAFIPYGTFDTDRIPRRISKLNVSSLNHQQSYQTSVWHF